MRRTQKPTLEKVLEIIKNNRNIVYLQDICATIGCCKMSFYNWFPPGTDEYEEITALLDENKTSIKYVIRDKLLECKSPVALIALYRLLGTTEERNALNNKPAEESKDDSNTEIELKMG